MNESTQRLPPSSPESERAVIGALILEAKDALPVVQERVGEAEIFYDTRHAVLWNTMRAMAGTGTPIDLVTLVGRLSDDGRLETVGGSGYLGECCDRVVSTSMLTTYLEDVWKKFQLRQAIRRATEIVAGAYEVPENVEEFLSKAEEKVFQLPRAQKTGIQTAHDLANRAIARIEKYCRGFGHITGVATGFAYWDKLTGGLQPGEVTVLGGRPGTGKTSLAMNVAERVAWWFDKDGTSRPGHPVGVLSMEMSADDLMLRLVCAHARVNFHKLRTGMMSEADQERLIVALPNMARAPIVIDDTSSLSAFEMRSKLRQMKARFGIKLAIIDYLQLAKLPPEFAGDRVNGVAAVSAALLASAKELQIPIIIISQLSRESDKRGGARSIPSMSDLRDSGAIEQDAHFIGILYKAPMEEDEEAALREQIARDPHAEIKIPVKMEVCKNRNGPSGTAMDLTFLRWCMRFEDLQRQSKAPAAAGNQKQDPKAKSATLSEHQAMDLVKEMDISNAGTERPPTQPL